MELEFVLLFLSALLGHGSALMCYNCRGEQCEDSKDVEQCEDGGLCATQLKRQRGADTSITRSCVMPETCTNFSLNLGCITSQMSCCSNDLCNTGPDPEKLNGQYCLGCLHMLSDFKCNRTGVVQCKGSQTKCGSLRSVYEKDGHNITIDFQGCVSESVCLLVSTKIIFGVETGKQFECCDGHLCNGSSRLEAVPVALLALCLYLLVSNNN